MKRLMLSAVSAALLLLPAASFAQVTTQYSEVNDLTMLADPTGAASLVRSKKSVHGRISTTLSAPGLPVTVWYIIFNKPHKCAGPIPDGGVTNCGLLKMIYQTVTGWPGNLIWRNVSEFLSPYYCEIEMLY